MVCHSGIYFEYTAEFRQIIFEAKKKKKGYHENMNYRLGKYSGFWGLLQDALSFDCNKSLLF